MENPVVGLRFSPTDEEMVHHYLWSKNLDGNTLHVDGLINTVDICSFDPWELPPMSTIKSEDRVWYFFALKKKKHNRGEQQIRKTKSGFWKKTGVTMNIIAKRGSPEKIGEKRVLVFHFGGSKSNWVMHEYHTTISSPNQMMMMPYTLCKVMFKGDEEEFSCYYPGDELELSGGLGTELDEGMSSTELLHTQPQEPQSPLQLTGGSIDAMLFAISNLSSDGFNGLLDNDDEQ